MLFGHSPSQIRISCVAHTSSRRAQSSRRSVSLERTESLRDYCMPFCVASQSDVRITHLSTAGLLASLFHAPSFALAAFAFASIASSAGIVLLRVRLRQHRQHCEQAQTYHAISSSGPKRRSLRVAVAEECKKGTTPLHSTPFQKNTKRAKNTKRVWILSFEKRLSARDCGESFVTTN